MARISGAKSLAVAFAAACLACSSAALVQAAPAGDSDQTTTVVPTITESTTTTTKRSPLEDFNGRDPVEIATPWPDATTDETSPPARTVTSTSTTTTTNAPALGGRLPAGLLPPDTTTPSDSTTAGHSTPSLTTTPAPPTTSAPSSRTDGSARAAIPGGAGPDEPSGFFVGNLPPSQHVHNAAPADRAGHPNLAATANPKVAAGGVAALGALGVVAGLIAYRGALVSQQRRSAARAALFGTDGGLG